MHYICTFLKRGGNFFLNHHANWCSKFLVRQSTHFWRKHKTVQAHFPDSMEYSGHSIIILPNVRKTFK